ncbi:MAG: DUF3086 domain-containing protein [Gloeocapsa sp. DLM2.Bin57]|nr:MAG: DUF3086 domain-containing protein [Gloeocapsa sp. DLM2.Bin57]
MNSEEFPKLDNLSTSEEITELSLDTPDNPLSESEDDSPKVTTTPESETLTLLQTQKDNLLEEINSLQEQKKQLQASVNRLVEEGLVELEQRKQALLITIEQLERRRDRIEQEMRSNFAGVSQELAIRVQGFKDYLVGSLQDLAASAEQLELSRLDSWESPPEANIREPSTPQFSQQAFKKEKQQIKQLIEQYRNRPDYYGPPWQLRRTFEPIHAERVENWFFNQGGRGAIRSMGSRLQNILVASAVIAILSQIYGDRSKNLILADSPERLGEWRRGLQDCLGISRSDFGPSRGIVLFENPEALAQKAERLVEDQEQPLIIIDEMEEKVSLSLLQFPLWLAFAPEPQSASSYNYLY